MGKFDESQIQQSIMKWAKMADVMHPELQLLHSIPNGASVSNKNRLRLYCEGLKSGIPDLFLPAAKGGYHGLYIEVKTESGRVDKKQKQIMELLTNNGYKCIVVRCAYDAIEEIETYLKLP